MSSQAVQDKAERDRLIEEASQQYPEIPNQDPYEKEADNYEPEEEEIPPDEAEWLNMGGDPGIEHGTRGVPDPEERFASFHEAADAHRAMETERDEEAAAEEAEFMAEQYAGFTDDPGPADLESHLAQQREIWGPDGPGTTEAEQFAQFYGEPPTPAIDREPGE